MDWSPDATPRYVMKYKNAGIEHSLLVRFARGTPMLDGVSDAQTKLAAFFEDLVGLLCEDLVALSAVWIPQDTNISVPAGIPTLTAGDQALADFSAMDKITHLTFLARSTGGSKTSIKVFGVQLTMDDPTDIAGQANFRIEAGESAGVDAAILVLQGSPFRAVDNTALSWKNYVDVKVNDFWLKQVRSGGITGG